MKFIVNRDEIIEPLQIVFGAVAKKQASVILSNILIKVSNGEVEMIGTDNEMEMRARIPAQVVQEGTFTLSARKFLDICKSIPSKLDITVQVDAERVKISAGRSRFSVATLPAESFPSTELHEFTGSITLEEKHLKRIIEKTSFAMGVSDVRYFLNGMLLDLQAQQIFAVATDGHRLALNRHEFDSEIESQILIPNKSITELSRLLKESDAPVQIDITPTHIQFHIHQVIFITKLIDGRYPEYRMVIPRDLDNYFIANREELRQALSRAAILSNEKFKGVNMQLSENQIHLQAHNTEEEEAEEELEVEYSGEKMSVSFNVLYLIEILNTINEEKVQVSVPSATSSCLLKGVGNEDGQYVLMPMRL